MGRMWVAGAAVAVVQLAAPATAEVAGAVPAADQAAIKAFLLRYYGSYKECRMRPGQTEDHCVRPLDWRTAFTPATRRLIATDETLTEGEAGAANEADPICGCQDYGTIRVTALRFARRADGRVTTRVDFVNLRPTHRTLIVERTPAGWWVHDILQPGSASYRQGIVSEIAELTRGKP